MTHTYDGDSWRVKKDQTGGTTYDKLQWRSASGDILAETDLAGNNPVEYIYFAGRRVARRDANGTVHYFMQDHLGSTRIIASASGAIEREMDYYPFGGERIVGTPSVDEPHKFAGMYLDSESGLYHTWARMYSPQLGRWLAPDFLGGHVSDPGSLNRYQYVMNNPVNFTDPLGLDCTPEGCYPGRWDSGVYGGAGPTSPVGGSFGAHGGSSGCTDQNGMELPCSIAQGLNTIINTSLGDESPGTPVRHSAGFANDWVLMNVGDMNSTESQQASINAAIRNLIPDLLNDTQCLSFLDNGKVGSAIAELTLAKINLKNLPPDVGAQAYRKNGIGHIEINPEGSFFSAKKYVGGIFQGGTLQARNLMLIHETGHLTRAIFAEFDSREIQDANNLAIIRNCQKALHIR